MAIRRYHTRPDLPPDVQVFRDRLIACTRWEKTVGPVTFYQMYGKHLIRSRSSLTGKRVKKDKKFSRTMHNADILKQASRIASPIYKTLTEDWRCHDLYRKLVGVCVKLLHAGATITEASQGIHDELYQLGYRTEWPAWEDLPPNLAEWKQESCGSNQAPGSSKPDTSVLTVTTPASNKPRISRFTINQHGILCWPAALLPKIADTQYSDPIESG